MISAAGQGDPLPLPARERLAALADDRIVAVAISRDELVGLGHLRRPLDLLACGASGTPKAMLLAIVSLNRNDSWKTMPDRLPQSVQLDVAQVHPVDQHPPRSGS